MLSKKLIIAPAISPIANMNATLTSVYLSTRGGNFVNWIYVQKTGGTNTGTQTITVLAASDTSGTGATAVPFRYRKKTTATSSDQWGAVQQATAAGFGTTANEDTIYEIELDPATLVAAGVTGKPFVALKSTQLVADTVAGAVIAFVQNPRFQGQTIPTVMS